ncbi:hypothetical protein ACIUDV_09670 [Limosilactobacillus reuteri]
MVVSAFDAAVFSSLAAEAALVAPLAAELNAFCLFAADSAEAAL